MKKLLRFALLLAALGTAGISVVSFHPQAEEVDDEEPPPVRDEEVDLYIKVYNAMQDDHDLTIEGAIRPHHMSLENFRQLERRIQDQPRLVDRVRQALLDHAKEHSALAQMGPTPTAPASTPKSGHRKK